MRKLMVALGGAVGILLFAAPTLLGCGDKYIVLGRGVRFGAVHMSAHPASILIYMNPNSHVPAAEKEFQLQAILKLAGHKPAMVEDQGGLARALNSGKYDLVLADLSDLEAFESEARSSPSKPAVLPVVYNPTGAELAQAEKQYSCVVKASKKNHDLLAVIDEAMRGKLKGTGAICQKGK